MYLCINLVYVRNITPLFFSYSNLIRSSRIFRCHTTSHWKPYGDRSSAHLSRPRYFAALIRSETTILSCFPSRLVSIILYICQTDVITAPETLIWICLFTPMYVKQRYLNARGMKWYRLYDRYSLIWSSKNLIITDWIVFSMIFPGRLGSYFRSLFLVLQVELSELYLRDWIYDGVDSARSLDLDTIRLQKWVCYDLLRT